MIWTEELKEKVRNYLDSRYPRGEFTGRYGDKAVINLGPRGIGFEMDFFESGSMIIVYADTNDDGDQFYPEDYDTFEEFMNAVCKEIDKEA